MPNDVTIYVSSRDNSGLDLDKLKARLTDLSKTIADARVNVKGDKEATLALDRMQLKLDTLGRKVSSPKISVDGAFKARVEIDALALSLDKIGGKSGTAGAAGAAASGLGALSGSAMPALFGAGVALSPILAAVGTGVGGFGLAAAGAVKPIADAASKTGGLQKNMHLLNPEQQALARGLLGLGRDYSDFQQQLQPEVFDVFNRGLHLASDLMHDVQPVATATGKAIGGLLGRVDDEFHSGTWQSFFGFMAREAGPDIHLVGNVLISVLDTLPPLLRDLQPLGELLLKDADATVKLAAGTAKAVGWLEHLGSTSDKAGGSQSRLGRAFHEAAQQSYPELNVFGKIRDYLFGTSDAADKVGKSATHSAAPGLRAVSNQAFTAGIAVSALNDDLQHLNNLLSDQSAQIAWKQAQLAATKAIEGGSKALDGNSARALANRQQVIGVTQQLVQLIDGERKTGTSVKTMAGQIQDQITWLQRSGDKSAWVRGELRLLRDMLHDIRSKHLDISVDAAGQWYVKGAGVGHGIPPGGSAPGAAAGMMVTGGTPGRDSVLINAMPGEVVVPTGMVNAGAVDHLRGQIPGFGGGGVVGSYHGTPPGLGKWLKSEDTATVRALADAVAQAFKAAAPVTGAGGGHIGWHPGAGVAQWRGVVDAALAQVGVPVSYDLLSLYQMMTESGGNPNIVNKWDSNWAAGHPSVGLMQVIAGTFDTYAGPYRNKGPFLYGVSIDPMANVYAAFNYAAHNGRGWGTGPGQIGSGHGYAAGGITGAGWAMTGEQGRELVRLPAGSRVYNHAQTQQMTAGAGGPVHVTLNIGSGSGHVLEQALVQWIGERVRVHGGGDVQVAFGSD